MSVEIILHPAKASKEDLRSLLEELGYKPCQHLGQWAKGSLNFHWFEFEGFKSYDGVEANIAKPSKEQQERLGRCSWMLHTRTRIAASPDDKAQQNKTIREAKRRFGGNFYNDWYGKNRYIQIQPDGREPIARGLFLLRERVNRNISLVRIALPNEHQFPQEAKTKYDKEIADFIGSMHPSRILYNALVPFAVASIEHFFGQTFRILLKYDKKAAEKLHQQSRKVDMADLLEVRDGSKTVEDIVGDWYSFQNIDSIHKAFLDWFSIDFWKVIRQSKKVGNNVVMLEEKLNEIIEFRHGIIHRYEIDTGLDKSQIEEILQASAAVIEAFVEYMEKSRNLVIIDRYVTEDENAKDRASQEEAHRDRQKVSK